jgi:hypothetical protein
MNSIQCLGSPFDPVNHYSSNSNRPPKMFRWSVESCPVKVLLDNAILQPVLNNIELKSGETRYGWICESRSIVPQLTRVLYSNHEEVFSRGNIKKIFTSDKELVKLNPKFQFCLAGSNLPWTEEQQYKLHNKTKLVSMIASAKVITSGHAYRHSIAVKYKDHIDLYGGAFGTKKIGLSDNLNTKWHNKDEALIDYMFSIVTENDKYDTYYTEKITDCFANGVIPVYWGPSDISNYFNTDGIITLDDRFDINNLTADLYYSKLEAIKDNMNRLYTLEGADDMVYRLIQEAQ